MVEVVEVRGSSPLPLFGAHLHPQRRAKLAKREAAGVVARRRKVAAVPQLAQGAQGALQCRRAGDTSCGRAGVRRERRMHAPWW